MPQGRDALLEDAAAPLLIDVFFQLPTFTCSTRSGVRRSVRPCSASACSNVVMAPYFRPGAAPLK